MTPQEWIEDVKDDQVLIQCHKRAPAQCAGAAVFRKNICKRPRNSKTFTVEVADRETVFANDQEFIEHHTLTHAS